MALSCELCNNKWCIECHQKLFNDNGPGDNHQKVHSKNHFVVKCMTTGRIGCDPLNAVTGRAVHVVECTHG